LSGHLGEHVSPELDEDEAEDLLILGIPFFILRVGDEGIFARCIFAIDGCSRSQCVAG
jgi:hypothetical protein